MQQRQRTRQTTSKSTGQVDRVRQVDCSDGMGRKEEDDDEFPEEGKKTILSSSIASHERRGEERRQEARTRQGSRNRLDTRRMTVRIGVSLWPLTSSVHKNQGIWPMFLGSEGTTRDQVVRKGRSPFGGFKKGRGACVEGVWKRRRRRTVDG